jgi:hypothetical protein
MTKVLVICEFGCADKNSTGHLVSQIPDLLDGADVEIIDTSTIPQPFRRLYTALEQRNRAGSMKKFVALLGLCCATLACKGGYDQVIVVSNPFLTLLLPPSLWRIKGKKLNYLILDLFPETLKATPISVPVWAYQWIRMLRNRNLRRANGIFVIGRDMKQHLSAQNVETNVIYVPLWIGATETTQPATSSVTEDTSADEKIRLNFFGNIGQVQNFDEVFRLLDSNTAFSLDVYGSGAKLKYIAGESQGRAHFFGAVPFKDRAKIFEHGSIGLVPQPNSLVGIAVPSKAFYYWSRGLPVLFLGCPESELGQIISEAPELGLIVPQGSQLTDIVVKLRAMSKNVSPQKVISICEDLRSQAQSHFLDTLTIQRK